MPISVCYLISFYGKNLIYNTPLHYQIHVANMKASKYYSCIKHVCAIFQLYSLIGFMFPEDSSPAFALFKFVQVGHFFF